MMTIGLLKKCRAEIEAGHATGVVAARERIWFSPHCLGAGEQLGLFGGET